MITAFDPQANAIDAQASRAPQAAAPKASQAADFSTFLKMLTTQMQNQNPLNPVEASDFAVQLATFSGVEQQVQTNALLSRLTERMLQDDMAAWLDTDVAGGASVHVSAEPLSLSLPQPASGTTRRDVVLSTLSGHEVLRLPVDLAQDIVRIDPSAAGPNPVLAGAYVAKVEDFGGSALLDTRNALQFSRVREAQRDDTGVSLVLTTGQVIRSSEVQAVRRD